MPIKIFSIFYLVCFCFFVSGLVASDAELKYCQMLKDSKRNSDLFESQWREKIDFSKPDETILSYSREKLTPLIMAVQRHDIVMVERLLAAKANPDLSHNGTVPLSHAVMYNDNVAISEIVQKLLDAKADPSIKDCLGLTPLHYACCKTTSHSKTVRKLLEAGSDCLCFAKGCGTPFDIVYSKGDKRLKEKLDLFKSMQMFQSNNSYRSLQKSKSGMVVISAFWQYVDGCHEPLHRLVDQNQQIASRYFTQDAIQKILISSELVKIVPKDRVSFAMQAMEERESSSPR